MKNELADFDRSFLKEGFICGIDEAGRGCLAGPVVAAAVVFRAESIPGEIEVRDSKDLTPKQREELFVRIKEAAVCWAVGAANWRRIDEENIVKATAFAMELAYKKLSVKPDLVLIDGRMKPSGIDSECLCVVKGDSKSFCIAAASIVAKVTRDRIMAKYHEIFPAYGFASNKGYPTVAHRRALMEKGPCPIHRKSFKYTLLQTEE